MFHENLDSEDNASLISVDPQTGNGRNRSSSLIKRKPVGTAPHLPKLNLDNSSTENLSNVMQQVGSSASRRVSVGPRGPRPPPGKGHDSSSSSSSTMTPSPEFSAFFEPSYRHAPVSPGGSPYKSSSKPHPSNRKKGHKHGMSLQLDQLPPVPPIKDLSLRDKLEKDDDDDDYDVKRSRRVTLQGPIDKSQYEGLDPIENKQRSRVSRTKVERGDLPQIPTPSPPPPPLPVLAPPVAITTEDEVSMILPEEIEVQSSKQRRNNARKPVGSALSVATADLTLPESPTRSNPYISSNPNSPARSPVGHYSPYSNSSSPVRSSVGHYSPYSNSGSPVRDPTDPIDLPPLPPKDVQFKQASPKQHKKKSSRTSTQFVDFPGVKGAIKNNPLVQAARNAGANIMGDVDSDFSSSDDDDDDEKFERNNIATGTIRGRRVSPPVSHSALSSVQESATAASSSSSCSEAVEETSINYWKYHIMKYSKDMYMTTNPDHRHISRPMAPSYYIDTEPSSESKNAFTLTFNNQDTHEASISVTRQGRLNGTTAAGGDSFSVSISCGEVQSWNGQCVQISSELHVSGRKKPLKCKQYSLIDPAGKEWIVGNRPEIKLQEDGRSTVRVASSKVFFFSKGTSGPDSDTILAVLRRRKPKRKRVLKEGLTKLKREEETGHLGHSRKSSTGNVIQAAPEEDDDDPSLEKVGWLYVLDVPIIKKPWVWALVTGLTVAVVYSHRLDDKDRSFHSKIVNWKQKAKGVLQDMQ
ncbi:hypothetical protein TRVA0_028S01156 [Trichomonascus vanleenenianus]|uniref:uncharacterized protein n=1 Tax=Trichomonascus vanleenenianus TaxID=2268995 RepID=UPI003ECACFE2